MYIHVHVHVHVYVYVKYIIIHYFLVKVTTLCWCCYLFLQVGDQVLELGGQSTVGMSHYEATSILRSSNDKIQLRVAENTASKSGWALFRTSPEHICTCINCDKKNLILQNSLLSKINSSSSPTIFGATLTTPPATPRTCPWRRAA